MRVCFLPCWIDGLSKQSASVRVRCKWVAKYWDEADVYEEGMNLDSYDALLFQKVYLTSKAKRLALQYHDKVKIFDLNDPMWEEAPHMLERQLSYMDAATCVTQPIADWLSRRLPTKVIPDRIDLGIHTPRTRAEEKHFEWDVSPQLCWAGTAKHFELCHKTFAHFIDERGLPFAVLADQECGNWPFIQWKNAKQEIEKLKQFDIILNPRADYGRWQYKSFQKTHKAWSLGIPVAHDVAELRELLAMTDEERFAHGHELRQEVEEKWDSKLSIPEWKEWIEKFL